MSDTSKRPIPVFRHARMPAPWTPPAAHMIAALVMGGTAFCLMLGLMILQSVLVSAWDVDMSFAPDPMLRAMGTVAVHLLVFSFFFFIELIIFLPLFLTMLWAGYGGWLGAALAGALAGTLRFLPFEDPTWAGALAGLFFGAVFGLAYHRALAWLGRRGLSERAEPPQK